MSLTIEQLDDECKERSISILIGKHFIIKFIPSGSVLDSNETLQTLIKTPDLLTGHTLNQVNETVKYSREIFKKLSDNIEFQEIVVKHHITNFEIFSQIKQDIIDLGKKISNLEKAMGLYLAKDHNLYFCSKCNTYLADSPGSLPIICSCCNENTNWGSSNEVLRFLENKVVDYLSGLWFEDYIAKLFERIGWKAWCHGSVMGSSGIDHQIDILAINSDDGRVLISECKSGRIMSKHIFYLSAQYYDINSNYGFLFSLKETPELRLKEYMNRTAGLYLLDKLEGLSDEDILVKLQTDLEIV